MNDEQSPGAWDEKEVELNDIVISNSWALQAILEYLDLKDPGARDQIWQLYLRMKEMAETAKQPPDENQSSTDETDGVRDN